VERVELERVGQRELALAVHLVVERLAVRLDGRHSGVLSREDRVAADGGAEQAAVL
jgi:hypothetical protein